MHELLRVELLLLTLKAYPLRTLYCSFLLAIAFFSFTYLRSISLAFSGSLTPGPEVSITAKGHSLAISMLSEIKSLPEVEQVSPQVGLGAYLGAEGVNVWATGVDPEEYSEIFGLIMDAQTRECFLNFRTGAIITDTLTAFGELSRGSALPLLSTYLPNKEGTKAWPMHLCGYFAWPDVSEQPQQLLFNYRYMSEASAYGLPLRRIIARGKGDPRQLSEKIDARYENSTMPTRSLPTDEATRLYARRMADMGSVAGFLIVCVFISSLFVSHSLYAQSLKERIREFRVLYAVGFGRQVLSLGVIIELMVLLLCGCLLGALAAVLVFPLVSETLRSIVGEFWIGWRVVAESILIAAALALVFGSPIPLRFFTQIHDRRDHG